MPKESSDGLPDVWTAKDKASYNRYQRSLRNVHLPDVWTDKDKASYDRYQQSLGKMKESLTTEKEERAAKQKGTLPAGYMGREPPVDTDLESRKGKGKAHDLESTFKGRAIPSENAKKYFGTGKAAPFDSEGGMRPGQPPSLYNPLKEKKGGTIKKKYAVGGKVSTAEKRNPKNPSW